MPLTAVNLGASEDRTVSTERRFVLAEAHLKACVLAGVVAPYSKSYRLVASGAVPAERVGAKWHVAQSDLPLLAEGLAAPSPDRRFRSAA